MAQLLVDREVKLCSANAYHLNGEIPWMLCDTSVQIERDSCSVCTFRNNSPLPGEEPDRSIPNLNSMHCNQMYVMEASTTRSHSDSLQTFCCAPKTEHCSK